MKNLLIFSGIILLSMSLMTSVSGTESEQSCDKNKKQGENCSQQNQAKVIQELSKAIEQRTAELKEAESKGRTEIANAIKKLVGDLKAMKEAAQNHDKEAFKAANAQREKDKEALKALIQSLKEKRGKSEKSSSSCTESSKSANSESGLGKTSKKL